MRLGTLGWTLAALAAVVVGSLAAALFLVRTDWAERRVENAASEALGREVDVEGLALRARWPPALHADRIRIANPEWAKTPHLVDARGVRAAFDASALLAGQVVISDLSVREGAAGLERDGERATWSFGPQGEDPRRFELEKATIKDGQVFYADHDEDTALDVRVHGSAGAGGELELQASGRFRGEEASATATLPGLLFSAEQPIEVAGTVRFGATQASLSGSFRAGAEGLAQVDAGVTLSGESLAALEGVLGFELPATPAYELSGMLRQEPGAWHLVGLEGRVGESDLRGALSYATKGERGFLSADLSSERLDFDDLGRKAREAGQGDALIPETPFDTRGWDAVDAEVRLQAGTITDAPFGTLANVDARLVLHRGRVEVAPLQFGIGAGRVDATVVLDSRETPLFGSVSAELRGIDPAALVEALRRRDASLGRVHGRIDLAGRGGSFQQLLGSSDGDVVLMMNKGEVNGLLVEALGLDLGEALLMLGTKKGESQVALRCAIADFNVQGGLARADAFVIDTSDTRIVVRGSIDLAKEALDLSVRPQPKDPSLGAARSPIEVSGTLKDPDVAPRAGPLAARGGAAALLGLVNPLLAVLPFIEPGTGEDADCRALLDAARNEAASAGTSKP